LQLLHANAGMNDRDKRSADVSLSVTVQQLEIFGTKKCVISDILVRYELDKIVLDLKL